MSRFYSCIHCQTQGGGVLTHVIQNWHWDFFFFKQNFCMGTWILNVCNWPLLFLKQGLFWEKDQLHEAGGRDMWAATPETLRITLEWSPRNYDYPRASQKGSGWCWHAPCCVWMTALPRSHSVPPPLPTTPPTPLLLLKKNNFLQSLFPAR